MVIDYQCPWTLKFKFKCEESHPFTQKLCVINYTYLVIDYTYLVIDYQWLFLKKSKDVTLQKRFLTFSNWFLSFSKRHNSSNGCLDQTWRVYKSKALFCILRILNTYSYNPLQALNLFELLLLLYTKKLSKVFWFFKPWKLVLFIFSSLLLLPKRIRQGLTAWILLCLPYPLSKNSKWHSLRILLILPLP